MVTGILALSLVLVTFASLWSVTKISKDAHAEKMELVSALERIAVTTRARSAVDAAQAQKILEMPIDSEVEQPQEQPASSLSVKLQNVNDELIPLSPEAEEMFRRLNDGNANDDADSRSNLF